MDKHCTHCRNQGFCHVFIQMKALLKSTTILHSQPVIITCITEHCVKFNPYKDFNPYKEEGEE